jgi:hypothetical protein
MSSIGTDTGKTSTGKSKVEEKDSVSVLGKTRVDLEVYVCALEIPRTKVQKPLKSRLSIKRVSTFIVGIKWLYFENWTLQIIWVHASAKGLNVILGNE